MRRGLFWYYFEENTQIPQVQRENTYPCRYLDPHGNQRFLFRVSYYERRINLEVFHALTDGLGAVNFLKSLTRRYLQLTWGAADSGEAGDQGVAGGAPGSGRRTAIWPIIRRLIIDPTAPRRLTG